MLEKPKSRKILQITNVYILANDLNKLTKPNKANVMLLIKK